MLGGMTKQTEQTWRERIREWRASGQTADEFARDKGYQGSTLRWWSARLGRADAAAAPRLVPVVARGPVVRAADGSLVRATVAASSPASSEVVVEVGVARVRVTRGFDDTLLARVVRALAAEAP
jgi:hypothetical protein